MASKQPIFTTQEFITAYTQSVQRFILNGSCTEKDKKTPSQLERFYANNEKSWANKRTSLEAAVHEALLDGNQEDTTANFMQSLNEHYRELQFDNEDYIKREKVEYESLDDRKKEIWERAKRDLQALQNIENMLNSNTDEAKEYKSAMTKLIYIYSNGKIKLREWFYRGQKTTEIGTTDLF